MLQNVLYYYVRLIYTNVIIVVSFNFLIEFQAIYTYNQIISYQKFVLS